MIKCIKELKRNKENCEMTLNEVLNIMKNNKDIILLDVRSPQEYAEGHLKGAINIPLYELLVKVNKLIQNKQAFIIVYCLSGKRSKKALKELKKYGYKNVYNLKGGLENNTQ